MTVIHNSLNRATELLRGFRRTLGLSEGGIERVSETLYPTFDIWTHPEMAVPRGEYPWCSRIQQAAVAAQYGSVEVGALDNTWIVIVEAIYPTTVLNVRWHSPPAVGGANVSARSRDTRHGWLDFLQVYYGSTGVAPAADMLRLAPNIWNPAPIILTRQYLMQIRGEAINTAIDVSIVGRVRQVYPGELDE